MAHPVHQAPVAHQALSALCRGQSKPQPQPAVVVWPAAVVKPTNPHACFHGKMASNQVRCRRCPVPPPLGPNPRPPPRPPLVPMSEPTPDTATATATATTGTARVSPRAIHITKHDGAVHVIRRDEGTGRVSLLDLLHAVVGHRDSRRLLKDHPWLEEAAVSMRINGKRQPTPAIPLEACWQVCMILPGKRATAWRQALTTHLQRAVMTGASVGACSAAAASARAAIEDAGGSGGAEASTLALAGGVPLPPAVAGPVQVQVSDPLRADAYAFNPDTSVVFLDALQAQASALQAQASALQALAAIQRTAGGPIPSPPPPHLLPTSSTPSPPPAPVAPPQASTPAPPPAPAKSLPLPPPPCHAATLSVSRVAADKGILHLTRQNRWDIGAGAARRHVDRHGCRPQRRQGQNGQRYNAYTEADRDLVEAAIHEVLHV